MTYTVTLTEAELRACMGALIAAGKGEITRPENNSPEAAAFRRLAPLATGRIQTRFVGNVGVDSGQLLLTDPCNLRDWNDNVPTFDNPGEYSYNGACSITASDELAGELNFAHGGPGAGVVTVTGYGDGMYPVSVQVGEDERVISMTVEFIDPYDYQEN